MNAQQKETLYRTAYSPLFECFVAIDYAHQDEHGRWIYTCHFKHEGVEISKHLFSENELKRFVL